MGTITKTEQIEWVELDGKPGTMPDEGNYLCAFSDGTVEVMDIDVDMINDGGWRLMGVWMTHWADVPAHPNIALAEQAATLKENDTQRGVKL